jgi:hypothetical protein
MITTPRNPADAPRPIISGVLGMNSCSLAARGAVVGDFAITCFFVALPWSLSAGYGDGPKHKTPVTSETNSETKNIRNALSVPSQFSPVG